MSHAGRHEGRDRDSTACPYYAKVMGEEREREGGPGAAYPKEDLAGQSSVRVEAVLPSPRAKARPLPRDWGGVAGQGRGSNAGGGLWVVAKPQRCSFALCPELFRQRCCRGWSLPPACPWAHHEPPLVPVSGRSGRHGALASAARQRPVGLPGRPNLPPQPARCPLPSSNLMAQARGSATKAA